MFFLTVLIGALLRSASSESIQVVTPESQIQINATENQIRMKPAEATTSEDSYITAYREVRGADRRTPLDSYETPYNTLVHSSYIDDSVYPELSYKARHPPQRYHPPPIYHPAPPVIHYHSPMYYHPLPFHAVASFFGKFGLHKIIKLLSKILVLKLILKFVAIIALFLVVPLLIPKMNVKDDTEEENLRRKLNNVTDMVWNGIEDEELNKKDMNIIKMAMEDQPEDESKKETVVEIMEKFVNAVNRILGVLMWIVKMKNNNMDTFDRDMLTRLSFFIKDGVGTWTTGWTQLPLSHGA